MGKVIRIGTRESQLAVWQATKVQQLLAENNFHSELVYIKSEGDIDLHTPLYEMGVQGIFTRSLDIALLTGKIDIAVHSMKDVPTQLPKGIAQAAVLKRASHKDLFVYKEADVVNVVNGEWSMVNKDSSKLEDLFTIHHSPLTIDDSPLTIDDSPLTIDDSPLTIDDSPLTIDDSPFTIDDSPLTIHHSQLTIHHSQLTIDDSPLTIHPSPFTIATSSIRRKAQWLNRYPHHVIENLRGNVNTRLRKVAESNWQGAIFAAAGLERIGLRPENSIELDWMLPAPAQGAIMVVCRDADVFCLDACGHFNDNLTALCTKIERDFLRILLGGCSTPISALAQIKDDTIIFKGNILSVDGKEKVEVEMTKSSLDGSGLGTKENADLGVTAAHEILKRGGSEIVKGISHATK